MANLQDILTFVNYSESFRTVQIMQPQNNTFDDYDNKQFQECFRLSKNVVLKLLEQVKQ